jgi:hypothetical protein
MNSIKDLKKSLEIIETLCDVYQECVNKGQETAESVIDDVYSIAHLHFSKSHHTDWVHRRDQLYREFKEQGLL